MARSAIRLETVVSALFEENCYLLARDAGPECLVIDPGLEPDRILARLEALDWEPAAVLLTHGHTDHIGGNTAIKQRWPQCPIIIGAEDAPKLTNPRLNLSADFGLPLVSPPADRTVSDGERIALAGFEIEVRAIGGHSRGQVVYVLDEQPPLAFCGDVIFAGSIGRTDFPDGDFEELASGIRTKLFTLPDETVLMPGHGPRTTVGRERRTNPFVGQAGNEVAGFGVPDVADLLDRGIEREPQVWSVAALFDDLEPAQVADRLGGLGHGVGHCFAEGIRGRAHQVDLLKHGCVGHRKSFQVAKGFISSTFVCRFAATTERAPHIGGVRFVASTPGGTQSLAPVTSFARWCGTEAPLWWPDEGAFRRLPAKAAYASPLWFLCPKQGGACFHPRSTCLAFPPA